MSRKLWKEARRHAKTIARDMDRTARLARKVPRWRVSLAAVGFKGFVRRWLVRWEERHEKALAKSLKKTTHFIIEEDRKQYHMRPGAPAAPKQQEATIGKD
jgi:hypothetical protein